jgi:Fic family protein
MKLALLGLDVNKQDAHLFISAWQMNTRVGAMATIIAGGESVAAYIPPPLPPVPPIDLLQLLPSLVRAEPAVGRLDGVAVLLPAEELLLYMYVRKEAVLSSQIKGSQSTLADLLRFEAGAQAGQPFDAVREVSNYIDAM